MSAITVIVPGPMRGKARVRFQRRGAVMHSFVDEKTESAENWVKACAIEQAGQPCLDGPLRVSLYVRSAVPASWSKKKQAEALQQRIHPTGKPDCDNVAKLVCDALNGIMWKDDSQVVSLTVQKAYAAAPETEIVVWQI